MTDFKAGDKVRLKKLLKRGVIIEINGNNAKVGINSVTFQSSLNDLELLPENPTTAISGGVKSSRGKNMLSLDLHGLTKEQSLKALERELNSAFLDRNCAGIEVIHGKGREIIKNAIKEFFAGKNLAVRLSEDPGNGGKTNIWLE